MDTYHGQNRFKYKYKFKKPSTKSNNYDQLLIGCKAQRTYVVIKSLSGYY